MNRGRQLAVSAAAACTLGIAPLAVVAPADAAATVTTAASGECTPGHVRIAYGAPSKSAKLADKGGIYKVRDGSIMKVSYKRTDEDVSKNFVRKTWDIHGDVSVSPKFATKLFANVEAKIGGSYKSDVWQYNSTLKIDSIKTSVTFKQPGRWLLYRGFKTWTVKWTKLQCNRSGMAERALAYGKVRANQRIELASAKCSDRGDILRKAAQQAVGC